MKIPLVPLHSWLPGAYAEGPIGVTVMLAALPFTKLIFWVGLIHVGDGLLLIFLVLLHSGKGGGLSDMFGSSIGSAAAGSTVAEKNLDRLTIAVAVIFAFSTVIVGLRWS